MKLRFHQFTPMGTCKAFFFLFNFLITAVLTSGFCSDSFCGVWEPIIRFPFQLQTFQPKSCGYPGFSLFCDSFNRTVVDLPGSGKFTVQSIDYHQQHIWLNDPENCLPKRLLNLNLSGSPFAGYFYQNFTFFNCTFDTTIYMFQPITCLSGENYTVLATSSERAFRFLESKCSLIKTVPVPVQWTFSETVASTDLSDDIRLRWAAPRCGRCESRGGRCGPKINSTSEIECIYIHRGLPRGARYAITVGAGLPAFLCLMGLLCCLCSRVKRYSRQRRAILDFSSAVAPQPMTTTLTTSGLDGPTIESYPKTILGESRRLPKPNDTICSICLSEYKPKDILRSIPECQHFFHAECIDEWLTLKASCPVCRNSPKSSTID